MYITYQNKNIIDSINEQLVYEGILKPSKPVLPEPQPDEELDFSPQPDLRRFV